MKAIWSRSLFLCALLASSATSLWAQDPRTPISAVPFTINAPGSYYLTGNLNQSGTSAGIVIAADNVTLDLNGFAMLGNGSGTVAGINVPSAQKNIHILNGTVRGWSNGGINAVNATSSMMEKLRVSSNTGRNTSKAAGLSIGTQSTVKECVVANNSNLTSGVVIPSLFAGDGSIVSGCTVANNRSCDGISAGNACLVSGCVTRSNFAGIRVLSACYVVGNVSDANVTGIAVSANQSQNRIEGNSCTSNTADGFLVQSGATNNLVFRNSARQNNSNYNIAIGNRYGTIVDLTSGAPGPVNGNFAPSSIGTADPWANLAY